MLATFDCSNIRSNISAFYLSRFYEAIKLFFLSSKDNVTEFANCFNLTNQSNFIACHLFSCHQWLFGSWFYRPEETFHTATRKFLEKVITPSRVSIQLNIKQM